MPAAQRVAQPRGGRPCTVSPRPQRPAGCHAPCPALSSPERPLCPSHSERSFQCLSRRHLHPPPWLSHHTLGILGLPSSLPSPCPLPGGPLRCPGLFPQLRVPTVCAQADERERALPPLHYLPQGPPPPPRPASQVHPEGKGVTNCAPFWLELKVSLSGGDQGSELPSPCRMPALKGKGRLGASAHQGEENWGPSPCHSPETVVLKCGLYVDPKLPNSPFPPFTPPGNHRLDL